VSIPPASSSQNTNLLLFTRVIRRLVILISTQATLEACSEASMKQAQSATQAAKQMMSSPAEPSKEFTDLQKKFADLEKGSSAFTKIGAFYKSLI